MNSVPSSNNGGGQENNVAGDYPSAFGNTKSRADRFPNETNPEYLPDPRASSRRHRRRQQPDGSSQRRRQQDKPPHETVSGPASQDGALATARQEALGTPNEPRAPGVLKGQQAAALGAALWRGGKHGASAPKVKKENSRGIAVSPYAAISGSGNYYDPSSGQVVKGGASQSMEGTSAAVTTGNENIQGGGTYWGADNFHMIGGGVVTKTTEGEALAAGGAVAFGDGVAGLSLYGAIGDAAVGIYASKSADVEMRVLRRGIKIDNRTYDYVEFAEKAGSSGRITGGIGNIGGYIATSNAANVTMKMLVPRKKCQQLQNLVQNDRLAARLAVALNRPSDFRLPQPKDINMEYIRNQMKPGDSITYDVTNDKIAGLVAAADAAGASLKIGIAGHLAQGFRISLVKDSEGFVTLTAAPLSGKGISGTFNLKVAVAAKTYTEAESLEQTFRFKIRSEDEVLTNDNCKLPEAKNANITDSELLLTKALGGALPGLHEDHVAQLLEGKENSDDAKASADAGQPAPDSQAKTRNFRTHKLSPLAQDGFRDVNDFRNEVQNLNRSLPEGVDLVSCVFSQSKGDASGGGSFFMLPTKGGTYQEMLTATENATETWYVSGLGREALVVLSDSDSMDHETGFSGLEIKNVTTKYAYRIKEDPDTGSVRYKFDNFTLSHTRSDTFSRGNEPNTQGVNPIAKTFNTVLPKYDRLAHGQGLTVQGSMDINTGDMQRLRNIYDLLARENPFAPVSFNTNVSSEGETYQITNEKHLWRSFQKELYRNPSIDVAALDYDNDFEDRVSREILRKATEHSQSKEMSLAIQALQKIKSDAADKSQAAIQKFFEDYLVKNEGMKAGQAATHRRAAAMVSRLTLSYTGPKNCRAARPFLDAASYQVSLAETLHREFCYHLKSYVGNEQTRISIPSRKDKKAKRHMDLGTFETLAGSVPPEYLFDNHVAIARALQNFVDNPLDRHSILPQDQREELGIAVIVRLLSSQILPGEYEDSQIFVDDFCQRTAANSMPLSVTVERLQTPGGTTADNGAPNTVQQAITTPVRVKTLSPYYNQACEEANNVLSRYELCDDQNDDDDIPESRSKSNSTPEKVSKSGLSLATPAEEVNARFTDVAAALLKIRWAAVETLTDGNLQVFNAPELEVRKAMLEKLHAELRGQLDLSDLDPKDELAILRKISDNNRTPIIKARLVLAERGQRTVGVIKPNNKNTNGEALIATMRQVKECEEELQAAISDLKDKPQLGAIAPEAYKQDLNDLIELRNDLRHKCLDFSEMNERQKSIMEHQIRAAALSRKGLLATLQNVLGKRKWALVTAELIELLHGSKPSQD